MKLLVADFAGFCYGVERAIKLATYAKENSGKDIFTLGPLIHNPQAVQALEAQGIKSIDNADGLQKGDVIVIRSHGVDPQIISDFQSKGVEVIDATCPFVKKAQQKAAELLDDGYHVVIIGEPNHPEVVGIMAYTKNRALVVSDPEQKVDLGGKVGIVVQTTQSLQTLRAITANLLRHVSELNIHNTICDATIKRQESAKNLANKVDVMIVVGGRNSANTSRLATICEGTGTSTYQVETSKEIDRHWFDGSEKIGVTAGASTPEWILTEVLDALGEIAKPAKVK